MKIYLVSCDDKTVYNKFISKIQPIVPSIINKDYEVYKLTILDNMYYGWDYFDIRNKKDIKILTKISNIINKHNNGVFNMFIKLVKTHEYKHSYIFIRIKSLKDINKFKRYYKRPNYKTVRIDNTIKLSKKDMLEYHNYKFDSRIQYINNEELNKQVKQFIINHLPTLKRIKNG